MYTEKPTSDIPNPYGYVYITTNLITGQQYCGKHKSPRFDPSYLGSGVVLKRDIIQYGVDCFKSVPIEWAASPEELHQKEVSWIQRLDAVNNPNWYNLIDDSNQYIQQKTGLNKEPNYIMVYSNEILSTLYGLPASCSTVLFFLLKHITYANKNSEKSMTVYFNGALKQKLIQQSQLTSIQSIDNALQMLAKAQIICRVARSTYQVNPHLFGKGKWEDIYELRMTHIWNCFGHTVVTETKRAERKAIELPEEDKKLYEKIVSIQTVSEMVKTPFKELLQQSQITLPNWRGLLN